MSGGRFRRLLPLALVLTWLVGIGGPEASAAPAASTFGWGPCPEGCRPSSRRRCAAAS